MTAIVLVCLCFQALIISCDGLRPFTTSGIQRCHIKNNRNTMNQHMKSTFELKTQQLDNPVGDGELKSVTVAVQSVAVLLVVLIAFQLIQLSSMNDLTTMQKEQLKSINDLTTMQKVQSSDLSTIDTKFNIIIGGTAFVIATFSGLNQIVSGVDRLDEFLEKIRKRKADEKKKKADEEKKQRIKR